MKRPADNDREEFTIITQKRCRASQEIEFYARFSHQVTLKSWLEVISNVLAECYFEVVKDENFQGLSVESIDASRVCMVQGRICASVEMNDAGPKTFCIRMINLLSCFRNVQPQHFFDLWRYKGSSDLHVSAFEPSVNTYIPDFVLKTLYRENDISQLESMEYDQYVEIDLQCFRNAVRTAKEHKVQLFEITIRVPKGQPGSRRVAFFIMAYAGDEVSSTFTYQSSSEADSEDGKLVIKASESAGYDVDRMLSPEETDVIFEGKFSVEYLFLFVKSMERHTVNLRVSQNKPLLVEYPLGCGPNNFVRFILAQKYA